MSRQSLAKAHQKIQELAWEPQYHEPYMKYGTDYTFRKAAKKDPLKQVLRSYFPMEEEKDHRVYGAQDGAIRGNMFRQVQPRWLEWQKLFLSIIPLPEISAAGQNRWITSSRNSEARRSPSGSRLVAARIASSMTAFDTPVLGVRAGTTRANLTVVFGYFLLDHEVQPALDLFLAHDPLGRLSGAGNSPGTAPAIAYENYLDRLVAEPGPHHPQRI